MSEMPAFPEIRRAFEEIDADSGGHLIGTVYPDMPGHAERFVIPENYAHLCPPAEAALKRLREASEEAWENFVLGEFTEQEVIRERQGDLEEAHKLMEGFFDGWPEEEESKT